MKSEGDHIIRSYREGDETEINELFNRIFGKRRALAEWTWKYRDNPVSDPRLICLAEANGGIIGQYACIPRRMKIRDATVNVSFVADNFVVPEHRGGVRGVQWKTFRLGCEHHLANAYACGFGFPNHEHYVVGKRFMQYRDFGSIDVLCRRLNWHMSVRRRLPWIPSAIVNAAGFFGALASRRHIQRENEAENTRTAVKEVPVFDERFDAFWEKVKDQHGVLGVRDREYLHWRYGKPGMKYAIFVSEMDGEMSGYLISTTAEEEQGRTGYIVDILVDERRETGSCLIRNALLRFLSEKADHVRCWMMGHNALSGTLERYGFVKDAKERINGVYMIFGGDVDESFICEARNWYVTMGDSDVF